MRLLSKLGILHYRACHTGLTAAENKEFVDIIEKLWGPTKK